MRPLVKVALGGTLAVSGSVGVAAAVDEGSRRSLVFWSVVAPIYAHYRFVQWRVQGLPDEEQDAQYAELHKRYAPVAEELTLRLKGFYLKNAQTISTRDEFVPPEYMEFCKRCQDKVPTEFAPGQPRQIVEEALDQPFDEVFEWWDDEPLGIASIGQAHAARLRDGRDVVVKVQIPGTEQRFRSDLKTMIRFCELAQPQHAGPLREIEKQFMTEFNYVGEAANMEEVGINMANSPFADKVSVPRPIHHLCRRHVLVMTRLHGVPLVEGIRNSYRRYAARTGTTLEALEEEARRQVLKKDVHESAREARVGRWLTTARNTGATVYNYTLGWFTAPMEYHEPVVDLGGIILLLNQVAAYQIFHDGAFNADPHPGNIMLCDDGTIGLIDYGQVKRLPLSERLLYADIVRALAEGRDDGAVDAYLAAGVRLKGGDRDIMWRLAAFWNDRDTDDVTGGRNVQTFMDWAEAEAPQESVPDFLVMPARTSILLRGIANAFGLRLRTAPSWAPQAEALQQAAAAGHPTGYGVEE